MDYQPWMIPALLVVCSVIGAVFGRLLGKWLRTPPDDLDVYIREQMQDPMFRAEYRAAQARAAAERRAS